MTIKPISIEGAWQEIYTPSPDRVFSPSLNVKLEAALFFVTQTSNIQIKTYAGNVVTLPSYPSYTVYPYPVTAIISSTAGSVIIVHDGQESSGEA